MRRIVSIFALASALVVPSAHAFFDPPWITPASPTASDVVSVNIHGGICDGIFERPGYPQITRNGNAIRVLEYGVHEDFQDWCVYPVGTYSVPLGKFSKGDYTLAVDFTYDNYPLGLTTANLDVIPFIVAGAAFSVPVPTLTLLWKVVLLALLLGTACRILAVQCRISV
jgi:hypothetical protein